MKIPIVLGVAGLLAAIGLGALRLAGEDGPSFARIRRLTNGEIALTLSVTNGRTYRIDASSQLAELSPIVSFAANATSMVYTDLTAVFLDARYYRAARLEGTNLFTGDYFGTTNGSVIVHPVNHATLLLNWNGKMIYNDPVPVAGSYASFPKADLILVSHTHSDHFNTSTLDGVRGTNVVIIAPRAATNSMSAALRALTITMNNGDSTNVMGLRVEAVPAYNSYHPLGTGNGYILTIADKRFYFSGDTGAIQEMRTLPNIDVAFVCMNLPYTMDSTNAVGIIRAFAPKVIYPYHYRNADGTLPDFNDFKRRIGLDLQIEVRLRNWY